MTHPTHSLNINSANGFQTYRRLLQYAKHYWVAFLIGIIGTILLSAADAGFAWVLKPILDKGFIAKDTLFIKWLPLGIVIAFILRGVAGFMSNYFMTSAGRNVVMRFRQEIFAHLLKLPARFYDNTSSGQLLSTLLYNVEQVAKASTDALVTVVQESFLITGLLGVMLLTSWQLSLLFLITTPLIATIARRSSKRMRQLSKNVQNSMGGVTHVAEEAIEGYKVIRMFGGENYETNKFNKLSEKNRSRELKVIATNTLASSGVQLVAGSVIACIIYLATSHYTSITPGAFMSMIASMLALLKPMRNLTTVNSTIQKGIAAAESIFALLDQPLEKDIGYRTIQRVKGRIVYENVSFAYHAEKQVLNNINFISEPGQTIALVGRSGSGKSTLINLLPRFYDGYSGKILIDDIDVHELKLSDLRNQFALVSQHVTLFNDTIANNIAYGRLSEVSETEIMEATKAAHAYDFIQELPQGLQTLVGENGVLLSGGQRQRLAIARALLKDAPILILDEATSALDTEAERHIQAALEELMQHRTTLVIAHRLSTVEKADKILVMDAGRIVEAGNHQELLALNGYYAKLYRMQFKDE